MSNYTTQMDAARKGIVTPEIEKVADKTLGPDNEDHSDSAQIPELFFQHLPV